MMPLRPVGAPHEQLDLAPGGALPSHHRVASHGRGKRRRNFSSLTERERRVRRIRVVELLVRRISRCRPRCPCWVSLRLFWAGEGGGQVRVC